MPWQQNVQLDGSDVAMDIFCGLDNARYAEFKMQYLNGLTIKSIRVPEHLNKILNLGMFMFPQRTHLKENLHYV